MRFKVDAINKMKVAHSKLNAQITTMQAERKVIIERTSLAKAALAGNYSQLQNILVSFSVQILLLWCWYRFVFSSTVTMKLLGQIIQNHLQQFRHLRQHLQHRIQKPRHQTPLKLINVSLHPCQQIASRARRDQG